MHNIHEHYGELRQKAHAGAHLHKQGEQRSFQFTSLPALQDPSFGHTPA